MESFRRNLFEVKKRKRRERKKKTDQTKGRLRVFYPTLAAGANQGKEQGKGAMDGWGGIIIEARSSNDPDLRSTMAALAQQRAAQTTAGKHGGRLYGFWMDIIE